MEIDVEGSGRMFVAAYFSGKFRCFRCTRCGTKISNRNSRETTGKVYDHWRFAHKTNFTQYALRGIMGFTTLWTNPKELPKALKDARGPYYVMLVGAQL